MTQTKIDISKERDIVICLMKSRKFARQIIPILDTTYIESEYYRIIISWLKNYWFSYTDVVKANILKLWQDNTANLNDEALRDNLLTTVENLSEHFSKMEWESIDIDYIIDRSVKYLKRRATEGQIERLREIVSDDDYDDEKLEKAVETFHLPKKQVIDDDDFKDETWLDDIYDETSDFLYSYDDCYGKCIGEVHRGDLISFLAPAKTGKTFALIEEGVRALRKDLNVVFISLEMTRKQIKTRVNSAITQASTKDWQDEICYFKKGDDGKELHLSEKSGKGLTKEEMKERIKNVKKYDLKKKSIKIFTAPTDDFTVDDLEQLLDDYEYKNDFGVDVVCIDYADLMRPTYRASEERDKINSIWKGLRKLAQKRKIAVITASQSNRTNYGTETSVTGIADDYRKATHVTCLVSLTKTSVDSEYSVIRVKQELKREGKTEYRVAVCSQNLSCGQFVRKSIWKDSIDSESDYLKRINKKRK